MMLNPLCKDGVPKGHIDYLNGPSHGMIEYQKEKRIMTEKWNECLKYIDDGDKVLISGNIKEANVLYRTALLIAENNHFDSQIQRINLKIKNLEEMVK